MTDWLTALHQGTNEFNITLSVSEEEQLARFMELLLERNRQFNLTAITDPLEVAVKHFVDSLTVETAWKVQPGQRAIDIGAGAGLPGIPLAIRHPEAQFVLNDSARKKVDFLNEAITTLGLTNVSAVWGRAEELGRNKEYRGYFDVALVRAVAHLGVLIEYCLPLLKSGGRLIAMKGPSGAQEVIESRLALAELGGAVQDTHRLTLPGAGERLLVVIRKARPTSVIYPRDPGLAKKKPLFLDSMKQGS